MKRLGLLALGAIALSSSIAFAQPTEMTAGEIQKAVKENVSSSTKVSFTPAEIAGDFVASHMQGWVGQGYVYFANNLGPSDSEFRDKDALVKIVREELIEIAKKMKDRGGSIFIAAGNTNSGIGRAVTAAQDSQFRDMLLKEYGVRLVTGGGGSGLAAMNHGPNKYGADFMNTKLDFALFGTDRAVSSFHPWVSQVNGISFVPLMTVEFAKQAHAQGIPTLGSAFIVREGAVVAMYETVQMIMETRKFAARQGWEIYQAARMMPITLQMGWEAGEALGEATKDKGNRAVTDLILAFYKLGKNSPEFRNIIAEAQITLEGLDAEFKKTRSLLSWDVIERTAAQIANSPKGKYALYLAQHYNQQIEAGASVEAIEKSMGVLSDAEMKELKAKISKLQAESPQSQELINARDILQKHLKAVRGIAVAKAPATTLQHILDTAQSQLNSGDKAWAEQGFQIERRLKDIEAKLAELGKQMQGQRYDPQSSLQKQASELIREETNLKSMLTSYEKSMRTVKSIESVVNTVNSIVSSEGQKLGLMMVEGKIVRASKSQIEKAVSKAAKK